MITRQDMGLGAPPGYAISGPVDYYIIHHTVTSFATDQARAIQIVKSIDQYHASLGWGGVGYSFLHDDVGNVYEGRGWWKTGAHTVGYNSKGYASSYIGNSFDHMAPEATLRSMAAQVVEGVSIGALSPKTKVAIIGHRDANSDTSCCGDPLYASLPRIRAIFAGFEVVVDIPFPEQLQGEEMRFVIYRIPNGTIYIYDNEDGSRKELISLLEGTPDFDAMNASQKGVAAVQAAAELIDAGIVAGGKSGTPNNNVGWFANLVVTKLTEN